MSGETVRIFVAVPLSDGARERLGALSDGLREALGASGGKLSYVRPGSIHLTLKFLGDVEAERVPEITSAVEAAAGRFRAFSFELGGVGFFGSSRRPRVIWVGVQEPGGTLVQLASAVDRACANLGFEPESRPFRAHLTLARVKKPPRGDLNELLAPLRERTLGSEAAEEVVLFQSELQATGARYTALARAELSAP
jgi:2'-5' RNA ligase